MYTEEHHAFLVSVKAIAGLSLILFVLQIIHLIKVCKQKYDDSHEMFHNYDSLYKLVSVLTYIVFWAWFFCIIVFISSSLSEHWKQYLKFKYSEGAVKNFGKDWCKDDNRWLCK